MKFRLTRSADPEEQLSGSSKTISIYNACGSDVSSWAISMAKAIYHETGKKGVLVELPCLGIPRLAYQHTEAKYEKEQSIDQLLMDYERDSMRSVEDYIVKGTAFDMIPIFPKSKPDLPTLLKLSKTKTLVDVPQVLKSQLSHYPYIYFVLQGQMQHPMTLISLIHASIQLFMIHDAPELIWTNAMHERLTTDYGVKSDNIVWFSGKDYGFTKVPIRTKMKDVVRAITKKPPSETEAVAAEKYRETSQHIGIVNPVEFIRYRAENIHVSSEMSKSDAQKLGELTDKTRIFLRDHYADDYVKSIFDEELRGRVCFYIADFIKEQNDVSFSMQLDKVIGLVQREITEMGVLQPLLDDPAVSSIEINSPTEIIAEVNGHPVHKKEIRFQSVEHIYRTIDKMLMPMGKTLNPNDPILDSNYRGFRINVTLDSRKGGVSSNSPVISIRKFPPDVYSNEACIAYGNLNEDIIEFQVDVLPCGASILVCGGTNSGKTSSLMRLPLFLDHLLRILTAEDTEEMMLKSKLAYADYPNMAAFLTKDHILPEKRITMAKLIKMMMRQNPDLIVVGEIRDPETTEQAIIAANTGHILYTSVHANSAAAGAKRLVQLGGNTVTAASNVVEGIDLIFFQQWIDGVRVITEISELIDFEGAERPIMNPIFQYNFKTNKHERVNKLKKLVPKMQVTYRNQPEILNRWCEQ